METPNGGRQRATAYLATGPEARSAEAVGKQIVTAAEVSFGPEPTGVSLPTTSSHIDWPSSPRARSRPTGSSRTAICWGGGSRTSVHPTHARSNNPADEGVRAGLASRAMPDHVLGTFHQRSREGAPPRAGPRPRARALPARDRDHRQSAPSPYPPVVRLGTARGGVRSLPLLRNEDLNLVHYPSTPP